MTGIRARGEDIRRFIIENVEKNPSNISKLTADHFEITRQAVNKHLQRLTAEKVLAESGKTRSRSYALVPLVEWRKAYEIGGERPHDLSEDVIWTRDIKNALGRLPDNVMNIWHHGFTEMFNNTLDHSDAETVSVIVTKNAAETQMHISDDGIGIFKKIQSALNLLDERHAVLELAKGKFTTDPQRHSGEGIFFSSRMFDDFWILSGDVIFSHAWGEKEDWIQEPAGSSTDGTHVFMKLNNHTSRTTTKVFNQFTTAEDYTFSKTIVPVKLAKYGDDNLISRSQAKRLLARIELFRTVLFDFKEVPTIGQAFADEIFRVFANAHPEIELHAMHANSAVERMIERVKLNVPLPEPPSSN